MALNPEEFRLRREQKQQRRQKGRKRTQIFLIIDIDFAPDPQFRSKYRDQLHEKAVDRTDLQIFVPVAQQSADQMNKFVAADTQA